MKFSDILKNELVFDLPNNFGLRNNNQLRLVPFAFFLIDNLKPHKIVGLGGKGRNLLLGVAHAATYLDKCTGELVADNYTDEFINTVQKTSEYRIKTTDQPFLAFLKTQADNSINLLILANDFARKLVTTDFDLIQSKLNSDNSSILFVNSEQQIIPQQYPSFSPDISSGLYVSLTGKQLPEELLNLTQADNKPAAQAIFSALGMRFEAHYQLGVSSENMSVNNLQKTIKNLREENRKYRLQIDTGVAQNLEQKERVIQLNSELNTAKEKTKKLDQRIIHIEEKLKEKAKDLRHKEHLVHQKELTIKARNIDDQNHYQYLEDIQKSLSYKLGFFLTWPARKIYDKFFVKTSIDTPAPALEASIQNSNNTAQNNGNWVQNTVKAITPAKKEEKVVKARNPRKVKLDTYHNWLKNNKITPTLRRELDRIQGEFVYRPKISIVVPVYNVEKIWLEKAINSIKSQIYTNWELCLADDASPKAHIRPMLNEFENSDERIKVVFRKENGRISRATNSALEIATGEYIAFMDNDDEIAEHALFEIVNVLNADRSIDFIYSDEDKIDEDGTHMNPHFKPDWSPELFLSYNYINHLVCIRRTIVDKVNGLRAEMDGCQDYDFLLRSLPHIKHVHHIPKVLYHWRALETSIAKQGDVKQTDFSFFAKGRRALEEHLIRHQISAKVIRPAFAVKYHLALYHLLWADQGPLVTIIINTDNNIKRLRRCLESIQKTSYKNYEIIVVGESKKVRTNTLIDEFIQDSFMPIRRYYAKGSMAEQFNKATQSAKGEYVLFLSNLVIPNSPDWLTQMVGYQNLPDIGVTGAKILFNDETIYHGGVITGLYPGAYDNVPHTAFRNLSNKALGYYFYPHVPRNYSAVGGGCCMMRKTVFEELGGFDSEQYPISYYDVDLCLKAQEKGLRNVYVSNAEMTYLGNKKVKIQNVSEIATFKDDYRDFEEKYYNKNFSDYQLYTVWPGNSQNYFGLDLSTKPFVLMVTHNLNFEGAPIQMYEIIKGILPKNEIQFEVISPKDGPLRAWYEEMNVTVHIKEEWNTNDASSYSSMIEDMKDWIMAYDFSAVFVNTLIPFQYLKAANEANIPSIWCIHESYNYKDFYAYLPRGLKTKAYECFAYPQMSIFVAKTTKDLYKSVNYKNAFTVINNGLRTKDINTYIQNNTKAQIRKELGIPKNKVVFLNLGTVCERKGQLDFTKAAIQSIESGNKNSLFYMVGARPDSYLDKINKEIQKSNTEEHFHIEMETGDVFKYYLAADVFVCTSYIESYPRVILEAMVFSLPILTTPIYGITEQVIKEVNAEFFRPGQIGPLAEQLTKFAGNPSLRANYAKNSSDVFRLVNTYDEMLAKYEKFIKSTCLSNYTASEKNELITVE